jgi:predicted DNA-binding transcriptional regulator AlpA
MAHPSGPVSGSNTSDSDEPIDLVNEQQIKRRNNRAFRRFSSSSLSVTAFAKKEGISRSSIYRRKSIQNYGHRLKGRRSSLGKSEYDAQSS